MSSSALNNGVLKVGGVELFTDVPAGVTLMDDPTGVGVFVQFTAEKQGARLVWPIGKPVFGRFTACHRYEPFWMKPAAGTAASEIPLETQSLLLELTGGANGAGVPGGDVAAVIPLIDRTMRCSVQGDEQGRLVLVAESNDPAVQAASVTGLFIAVGSQVHTLCERGAEAVMAHLKTGRLRKDKRLPRFVRYFGWCTWDAFYGEVSHEKVRQGLERFRAGGIQPRSLILDDGWQGVGETLPTGSRRLTGFEANAKFPGDLKPTVDMAKDEFGVEQFLVWHAFHGYWAGIDAEALPGYGVRYQPRRYSPGINQTLPGADDMGWCGTVVGIYAAEQAYRFYQDYHRHLRLQGVDGVKVDNQAAHEGVCQGQGGRVAFMRIGREALEGSAQTQFDGTLINCMSCSNEMLYQMLNSTLFRSSTDFWPKKPETHGLHLYTNAQVCAWWGQFGHGDWDMFQSGHEWGAYHAAGRAVSGSPVYVSDKPGEHNFDLLRKLVLSDGTTLLCDQPGVATRDCLFHDVLREDVLLKIWNTNGGGASGVVGLFNGRYAAPEAGGPAAAIRGCVKPADVPTLTGEKFAVYLHVANKRVMLDRDEAIELTLAQGEYEIATIVPVTGGVAAIGLLDKFNSGGAISATHRSGGVIEWTLRDGGKFGCRCDKEPAGFTVNGQPIKPHWHDGWLTADLPVGGQIEVRMRPA
ncbi:MAG: Sip1-related alpha-galactosidase [Phycisphaerales bacterium]